MTEPQPEEPHIDVLVEGSGWTESGLDAAAIARRAAAAALRTVPGLAGAEVSILLADDSRLADLNRDWRGREGPTNVLSFPGDGQRLPGVPVLLGDVVVSCRTVVREAAEAGIPAEHHLSHMVVHGVLHLLGYDHESELDATVMEQREGEILRGLGIPDPYAGSVAVSPGVAATP